MALAIFALVMASLYGAYEAVTRSAERVVDSEQGLWRVLQIWERQCRCAYAPQVQPATVSEEQDSGSRRHYFVGQSESHEMVMRFLTLQKQYSDIGERKQGRWVTYRWDRSQGLLEVFVRNDAPWASFDDTQQQPHYVLAGVEQCHAEFFDGRDWHSQWPVDHETTLPVSVRLRLVLGDEEDHRIEVTRQVTLTCGQPGFGSPAQTSDTVVRRKNR